MDRDFTPLLAELTTGLWRLQGKLTAAGCGAGEESAALLRSVSRQVRSMTDALADAGIEVQAHTGQPFDPGQLVQVVAFVPDETAARETVNETITPTVYVDGRVVQMGQVIVVTPGAAVPSSPVPSKRKPKRRKTKRRTTPANESGKNQSQEDGNESVDG